MIHPHSTCRAKKIILCKDKRKKINPKLIIQYQESNLQEPQPQCLSCQTTCTVKHILIECRTFAVIRKRFFKVNNLTDLFENGKIDDILSFLRETELYQKYDNLKLVNIVQTN